VAPCDRRAHVLRRWRRRELGPKRTRGKERDGGRERTRDQRATPCRPHAATLQREGYRVVAGRTVAPGIASTHSPLMRTTNVPVRAFPCHPSGRKPISAPEMTGAVAVSGRSWRDWADAIAPTSTTVAIHRATHSARPGTSIY